jgi:glycosyltransferase involved in cell wall biosynthesis
MKISVITVCFNSAATICRTIESFLAQDWPDKEMVIVDGASSDGTADLVRRFPQQQLRFMSEPDNGMYDALNKGLALYSGDAVGVLNSDDAFHDAMALSRIGIALMEHDMVHGDLDFVSGEGGGVVRRWRAEPRPQRGFKSGWMPAHPTFYVRRKVAEWTGLFDLGYQTASDYEWMLRAIEFGGFSLATVNSVLVDMRQGGRSTSGIASHLHHNLEALRARRKWLGAGLVDYALFAKPARKLAQFVLPGMQRRSALA